MFRRGIIAVLCCFALAASAAPAKAQAAPQARVWLVLDASIDSASGLSEALAAQLGDLDVEISTRAAEGTIPAAALALARSNTGERERGVVWIAQQGEDLLVFVVEPAADKTLLRSLPRADPAAFVTQETVAVIVRSSIEGLLTRAPIGFVPPPPPPVVMPPPPTLPLPKPERFVPELNVGYVGAAFARQIPWQHGVRVAGGVSDLFRQGPYALLALSLLRDERVVDQGVSLLLTRTPIELAGGFRFERAGFAVVPELLLGLEITSRDARANADGVKASAERRRISSLLGGHLWLMRALGGPQARSWLAVGGGVEAVLNNVDYRVEIRRGTESVSTTSILVSPRTFRPVALVSLRVKL